MKLLPFEPGDQTRYVVAFERVEDRPLPGLTAHSWLFVWGLEESLAAHTFERSSNHQILSWDYYRQKMASFEADRLTHSSRHVLLTGFHVLAHLLGRRTISDPGEVGNEVASAVRSPEQLGWRDDWREQLTPLLSDPEGFPIKPRDEIQRAHDMLKSIIERDVPLQFSRQTEQMLRAQLDALCWVLEHDHNPTFGDNLAIVQATFEKLGVTEEVLDRPMMPHEIALRRDEAPR